MVQATNAAQPGRQPGSAEGVPLTSESGSRNAKRAYGAILIVLAAGCGYLATRYGVPAGIGAAIFGVAGLSAFLASFGFSGTAPCPSCGKAMTGLPREMAGAPCASCGAYAVVRDGRVYPTPADHVASSTVYSFAVEPGTQPSFPPLCVGCGAPATQHVPWELTKTVVGAPGVGRVLRKWSIQVPMCAAHAKPGALGLPTGITSFGGSVQIQSHRAWLALTGKTRLSESRLR